jgi:hypothetical protein
VLCQAVRSRSKQREAVPSTKQTLLGSTVGRQVKRGWPLISVYLSSSGGRSCGPQRTRVISCLSMGHGETRGEGLACARKKVVALPLATHKHTNGNPWYIQHVAAKEEK